MRVLFVTGVLNRGGAEIMLLDLVRNFSSNIKVHVLVNYLKEDAKEGVLTKDFEDANVTIHYTKTQWSSGLYSFYKSFSEIIESIGKVDIIHSHINVKSGFVGYCAAKNDIPRIITHSHGEIYYPINSIINAIRAFEFWFQKKLIKKYSSDYWACSLKAGKTLFSSVNDKDIRIINNAIDVRYFTSVEAEEIIQLKKYLKIENKLILGSVGRVVARKNLLFIVEILNELRNRKIDFVFVNIGKVDDSSYYAQVEEKIKEYNLHDFFLDLGLQSNVPLYMTMLDIFISPAKTEAFGMVAIESQACTVPTVISTEFPTDVDMDLGLVTFIDEFDSSKWADTILQMKNIDKPSSMDISQQFIKKGFDVKSNSQEVERNYVNRK